MASISLLDLVFSWSLDEILNKDLFKYKVRQIPKSFSDVTPYLESFIFPLVEETRADLCSSLTILPLIPTCELSCIEPSKDYKPPDNLIYIVDMEMMGCVGDKIEPYEPEPGDIIALANVRPNCLSDLDKPELPFILAYVEQVQVRQNENEYRLRVKLSKPIPLEVLATGTTFSMLLGNLTTNIRIWKSLKLQLGEGSFNIFHSVLQMDPTVCKNCAICFERERNWIENTTVGAMLRSLDLNQAQADAVLQGCALKECYHKSTVKLVWGPPGTGKTKTIASFLFAMLKMKCNVVTCAPTNIAVVEVIKRLLNVASKSFDYGTYGLGNIVLFGNGKRMKIGDHDELFDVFLDFRVHMLNKCFQQSSGWSNCLKSMICLLEKPEQQYLEYLKRGETSFKCDDDDIEELQQLQEIDGNQDSQNTEVPKRAVAFKRRTWKKIIHDFVRPRSNMTKLEKLTIHNTSKFQRDDRDNGFVKKQMTYEEYVRWSFHSLRNMMKFFANILFTHLPTSCISLKIVERIIECLSILDALCLFSDHGGVSDIQSNKKQMECLKALQSLQERFDLPEVFGKHEIRRFCLQNGHLFFCTVSGSIKLHEDGPSFKIAVIDEAAQLKECESTITLQLPGLRHAILIGDDRQLPAMVKSKASEQAGFGRSLFERLVSLEHERHLLNVQYRMHPSISLFPNMEFYQKQILDAPSVAKRRYPKHILQGIMFNSYSFIDVTYGEEILSDGHSLKNPVEVAVVCEIVCKLFRESKPVTRVSGQRITVGIVSSYKSQVNAIDQKLKETNILGVNSGISVSVRSVDGFQGGEEDIIIISTVRCNGNGSVGFLSDLRRTNVALTRARHYLWIIGNGETLINSDSVWKNLVVDAKMRKCYFDAKEDDNLSSAIASALVDLGQIDTVLHANSLLFKRSKWKVYYSDNFVKSLGVIEKVGLRKKVLSLVSNLATGWRKPHGERCINFKDGIPDLLEYLKVDDMLYLVWHVDVIEETSGYVQILKFCDVLQWFEIPKLVMDLNSVFATYTEDHLNCCKLRCSEGGLEMPMTWSITASNYQESSDCTEMLSGNFAVLGLND